MRRVNVSRDKGRSAGMFTESFAASVVGIYYFRSDDGDSEFYSREIGLRQV